MSNSVKRELERGARFSNFLNKMKLPVRKCFHTAKVGFFFLLVIIVITLFEQWRGGKRTAQAQTPEEELYEQLIREDEARIVPGLGENGEAAELTGEDKRLGEESEKKLAVNVYLSDRISYNRTLKDHRNPACERVIYDAELPSASVILIFHNEPYSVVVRTIWSVVNSARRDREWFTKANYIDQETGKLMKLGYAGQDPSSPFVYLKEIILVDDNSTLPELKGKLDYYVRTRLPPDLIRIIRLPNRQGLMRARIRGARSARGDVLVFLDAHCETSTDWLRPLLQRIRHKRDVAVTPLIDVIDQTTFELQAAPNFQVGGFTFMGHFTWIDVPEREKKRRGSDIAPTWSPTMAGGLFAISRQYFWEVGAYDEQMGGWGGENLEMSFRIWQCGGTLETIPCSRVGHVFRSFHPYGLPANTDTHGINTARMAEVWMDDYAELFYLHRPDLRKSPKIGDVTHRRVLREKLKCKSFQWYLDNVYREKFVPVRDVFGFGRFKNPSTGMCIDTLQHEGDSSPLGVYPCHTRLEPTQHLALSLRGELRDEERCAEPRRSPSGSDSARQVVLVNCHGRQRGQKWRYLDSKQLQHVDSGMCLTSGARAGELLAVSPCLAAPLQLWQMDYSELNGFRLDDSLQPSEQEIRLKKLRGQRRIARSLKSISDQNKIETPKKRIVKNKFILKMLRRVNGTDEHLEAEIYCRHKRLYPNNTFVRDLVKILNAKDIRIINNGRVFEHSMVRPLTALERELEDKDKALRARPVTIKHREESHESDKQATEKVDVSLWPQSMAWRKIKLSTRLPTTTEIETIPDDSVAKEEDSLEELTKAELAPSTEATKTTTDNDSDEDWPVEVTYMRAGSHPQQHSDEVRRIFQKMHEAAAEMSSEGPDKLIVRSNLTVDLDDFFGLGQREKTVDDIENLIEDTVPKATEEPRSEENTTAIVKQPQEYEQSASHSESKEND